MPTHEIAVNDFLFLTTTQDCPRRNPAIQTLIRQHVMQDIGKTRQSKGNCKKRYGQSYADSQPQLWLITQTKTGSQSQRAVNMHEKSTDRGTFQERRFENQNQISSLTQDACSLSTQQADSPDEIRTNYVPMPFQPQFDTMSSLGSGRSDPFMHYPINVNSETRRLISYMFDDSLTGNFGLYRNGWLPVGLTDAAAFQQVLSMFVVHLHSLYGHGMGFPITESLSHHGLAIRSVNERLASCTLGVSDGVIGAVIGFVCHAHLTQQFERWHMHMKALKEIIRIRGGLGSFHQNTLLRTLLFFVDVIGSSAQDTPPYFPIPYNLLPSIPSFAAQVPASPTFGPISRKLHERYEGEGTELNSLFADLDSITAFFSWEHAHSAGRIWRDSTLVQSWIDPLAHRLLCAAPPFHGSSQQQVEEESNIVWETCRLAALLYLAEFRRRAGVLPVRTACQLAKLKHMLQNDRVEWFELRTLRLWALTLGAVEAGIESDRTWFVAEMVSILMELGLVGREQIDPVLQSLVWCDDIFQDAVGKLCKDVHTGLTASYGCQDAGRQV